MEIHDLKDLKEALGKIPDKILEQFGIFITEEGNLRLGCSEGEDEGDMIENCNRHMKQHPEIKDVDNLLKNIEKEYSKEESEGELIDNIQEG